MGGYTVGQIGRSSEPRQTREVARSPCRSANKVSRFRLPGCERMKPRHTETRGDTHEDGSETDGSAGRSVKCNADP